MSLFGWLVGLEGERRLVGLLSWCLGGLFSWPTSVPTSVSNGELADVCAMELLSSISCRSDEGGGGLLNMFCLLIAGVVIFMALGDRGDNGCAMLDFNLCYCSMNGSRSTNCGSCGFDSTKPTQSD